MTDDVQALKSSPLTVPMDDVPPAPASYGEYLERRLNDAVQEAYTRGFNRGARRQVLVLCAGLILGCMVGFYLAVAHQLGPRHGSAHVTSGQ